MTNDVFARILVDENSSSFFIVTLVVKTCKYDNNFNGCYKLLTVATIV